MQVFVLIVFLFGHKNKKNAVRGEREREREREREGLSVYGHACVYENGYECVSSLTMCVHEPLSLCSPGKQ